MKGSTSRMEVWLLQGNTSILEVNAGWSLLGEGGMTNAA